MAPVADRVWRLGDEIVNFYAVEEDGRLTIVDAGARVLVHADAEAPLREPRPKGGDARMTRLVPQLWRPSLWRLMIHFARLGVFKPPHVEGAETYGYGDVLDVPGRPRAIPAPGHAPGHTSLLLEDRGVLLAG
jgi:glyoxylase-like metal-dependent hydrolase (beta-lactamase superfamily II)